MNIDEIQRLYDAGNTKIVANMISGEKMTLRLFTSTMGQLAYFAKGKHRRGYSVSGIVNNIVSLNTPKNKKAEQTKYDKYIANLRKFQKAYTQNLHPNLWPNLRAGYSGLDISEFESFIDAEKNRGLLLSRIINRYRNEDDKIDFDKNDGSHLYDALSEFARLKNLDLNTENVYKTTAITSNKPTRSGYTSYKTCLDNIKNHLDNKEGFSYSWESGYDVTVDGKLCDDEIYRAWFSLEKRGCGNGHYYLLINENQAVFSEDD